VGATVQIPPESLHCAIDFTPVGGPVSEALKLLERGDRLVINALRKEELIPPLDYTKQVW